MFTTHIEFEKRLNGRLYGTQIFTNVLSSAPHAYVQHVPLDSEFF
jgi:hypothetical protein